MPMLTLLALLPNAQAISLELSPGDDVVSLLGSLSEGDQVTFGDGLYEIASDIVITAVGTEAEPISIKAAAGAHPVVRLGPTEPEGLSYASQIVQLYGAAWVEIEGISFEGDDTWDDPESDGHNGITIWQSSHISLTDVEVSHIGGTGVYIYSTDVASEGIDLERVHIHHSLAGHGVYLGCSEADCFVTDSRLSQLWIHDLAYIYGWGVNMNHGSQNVELVDSVIYNVAYNGVHLGSAEFGDPNIVARNAIWNVNGVGLRVAGASQIQNNVIFNIGGKGIHAVDPGRDSFDDVVISHNTVAETGHWAAHIEDWPSGDGHVLANNALCNVTGYGVSMVLEAAPDTAMAPEWPGHIRNNIICGLSEGLDPWEGHYLPGAGYTDFIDIDGWNLYPTQSATLIDAGDASGEAWVPTEDFNGALREGDAPDVGAYEWSGEDNPGWTFAESFKDLEVENQAKEGAVGGGCCEKKESNASQAVLFTPLLLLGAWARRRED